MILANYIVSKIAHRIATPTPAGSDGDCGGCGLTSPGYCSVVFPARRLSDDSGRGCQIVATGTALSFNCQSPSRLAARYSPVIHHPRTEAALSHQWH